MEGARVRSELPAALAAWADEPNAVYGSTPTTMATPRVTTDRIADSGHELVTVRHVSLHKARR